MGWFEALKKVSSFGETFQKRTEKLCGRDWYRLRRLMEVALAVEDCSTNIYTGERTGGLSALGYDVRYFFLCPNDRMKHARILDERCEQMIARGLLEETLDLALSGNLPHGSQASRSIGYRQVLSYLRRSNPKANDVTTFENFLDEFTAATRQYSKKQMQWFRRDKECIFIPVDLSSDITKDQRIEEAAKMIMNFCIISREDYEMELTRGEFSLSEKTKKVNEEQAKGMRVFLGKRNIYKQGSDELKKILQVADTCTSKINSSNGDFGFPQKAVLLVYQNFIGCM
jgi:tRNA dimethylallyltransferase